MLTHSDPEPPININEQDEWEIETILDSRLQKYNTKKLGFILDYTKYRLVFLSI